MRLDTGKNLRRHLYRGMAVAFLSTLVFFFQNCAPAFDTNELGEIKMSSFDGPIEYLNYSPAKTLTNLPRSTRSDTHSTAGSCVVGADCRSGVVLKK